MKDDQTKHLVELYKRASAKGNTTGAEAVVCAAKAAARAEGLAEEARRFAIFADAV